MLIIVATDDGNGGRSNFSIVIVVLVGSGTTREQLIQKGISGVLKVRFLFCKAQLVRTISISISNVIIL